MKGVDVHGIGDVVIGAVFEQAGLTISGIGADDSDIEIVDLVSAKDLLVLIVGSELTEVSNNCLIFNCLRARSFDLFNLLFHLLLVS